MAVPAEFTILDLSGKFIMNKTLSDDTDRILELQGVGWFKRKAILLATITLNIKHYKNDQGIECIDIDQTLTGGISGTSENRMLTWTERRNEDHVFGPVLAKSRRIKVEDPDLEGDYLKKGWTADTIQHGVVQSYAQSDTEKSGLTWIGDQTWGIEEVDGLRRYSRHLMFSSKGEDINVRLIYDYIEPSSN